MNAAQRKRAKLNNLRSIDRPSIKDLTANELKNAEIRIEDFVNVRESEIKNMEKVMLNSLSHVGKRVFQTLPRVLRRRAASHNRLRLPFGLRKHAAIQDEDGASKRDIRSKRKSSAKGKSRRWKKANSRSSRAAKIAKWSGEKSTGLIYLTSHIWHAKRMKMRDMWGYRLPLNPTEKSRKRIYRGYRYKSVLQDISYYESILVEGESIKEAFQLRTDPDHPKICFSRENVMQLKRQYLYQEGRFPLGLICPFDYVWLSPRKLVAFIHSAAALEFRNVLLNAVAINFTPLSDFHMFSLRGPTADSHVRSVFQLGSTDTSGPHAMAIDFEVWQRVVFRKQFQESRSFSSPLAVDDFLDEVRDFRVMLMPFDESGDRRSFGLAGWNVLVSSKYSRCVWNALVRRNLIVTGLKGEMNMRLENGALMFPFDYVETHAFSQLDTERVDEMKRETGLYPPAKKTIRRGPTALPLHSIEFAASLGVDGGSYWTIRSMVAFRKFQSLIEEASSIHEALNSLQFTSHGSQWATFARAFVHVDVMMLRKGTPLVGSTIHALAPATLANAESIISQKRGVISTEDVESMEPIGCCSSGDVSIADGRGRAVGACKTTAIAELYFCQKQAIQGRFRNLVAVRNAGTGMIYLACIQLRI